MGAPFFSVVIDNYNYGRYIADAVDSVLAQDFPARDVEVIVVDDGSTDQSRAVLAGYGERIRVVLQKNQGQATAFNQGFAVARGEVVCLLDSDDWWRPAKLTTIAPLFDDASVGAAQHWLEDTDAAGVPLPQTFRPWPKRYVLDDFLAGRTHFAATSGLAVRRRILSAALPIPKDLFYYLDDYLEARALFESELANVPAVLGAHRVHGGNWCAGGLENPRKLELDLRMRALFSRSVDGWLAQFGKELTPAYRKNYELESWRRRVLREALNARPVEAWNEWREGFQRLRGGGFAGFRAASLLLAVASPALYLAAYEGYARASAVSAMRSRMLPER